MILGFLVWPDSSWQHKKGLIEVFNHRMILQFVSSCSYFQLKQWMQRTALSVFAEWLSEKLDASL